MDTDKLKVVVDEPTFTIYWTSKIEFAKLEFDFVHNSNKLAATLIAGAVGLSIAMLASMKKPKEIEMLKYGWAFFVTALILLISSLVFQRMLMWDHANEIYRGMERKNHTDRFWLLFTTKILEAGIGFFFIWGLIQLLLFTLANVSE